MTDKGREIAERIYERHQFFTMQLITAGVDPEIAEYEACKMEHTISDDSFKLLKERKQKDCPFAASCRLIAEYQDREK